MTRATSPIRWAYICEVEVDEGDGKVDVVAFHAPTTSAT